MTSADAPGRSQTVADAARAWAPDLYISALLAPPRDRDDLITLAAFWGEIGRVALTVGEDMLGEIRLQWWRDSLADATGPTGHPVADAMQRLMMRRGLDASVVDGLLDARGDELRRLPFAAEADFGMYLDRADGGLLRLGAVIRGVSTDTGAELLAVAAQALGRVRVAVDLPYFAAKARLPLWPGAIGEDAAAEDASGDGAEALRQLTRGAVAALADLRRLALRRERRLIDAVLPVALLEPYLRALETKGRDALRDVAAISPLTRISRLTWAHVTGRI